MRKAWAIVLCLVVSAAIAVECFAVCGALWPSPMRLLPGFDTSRPEFSRIGEQRHVLLFSQTEGYRRDAVIAATQQLFEQIAADNSWFVYATENAAIFSTETLREFDSVVFNNLSGLRFTQDQQAALTAFEEAGGGVLKVHKPSIDSQFRKQLAEKIRHASPLDQLGSSPAKTLAVPRSLQPGPASGSPAPRS